MLVAPAPVQRLKLVCFPSAHAVPRFRTCLERLTNLTFLELNTLDPDRESADLGLRLLCSTMLRRLQELSLTNMSLTGWDTDSLGAITRCMRTSYYALQSLKLQSCILQAELQCSEVWLGAMRKLCSKDCSVAEGPRQFAD